MPQKKPLSSGRQTERGVTANEVAEAAGVSRSAVSRTFTPGASVSPQTRDKVEEAARKLGYSPNRLARSLTSGKSNTIGLAVGYMDNQFYPALIESISERLAEHSMRVMLFPVSKDAYNDLHMDDVLAYQVDGVLMASAPISSKIAEECHARGVPVVLVNRTTHSMFCSSVTGDNLVGAREIGELIAGNKRARPAFLAGLQDSSTNNEREQGYVEGLASKGVDLYARACGNYTWSGAKDAMRELLNLSPQPDAVFCANDHMAIAALEVARTEYDLTPGADIDIVGFDDVDMASWPSFDLTTYSQPVDSMAEIAVELLLGAERSPKLVRTKGQLIVRSTTRK